jgi:hypothetical protein
MATGRAVTARVAPHLRIALLTIALGLAAAPGASALGFGPTEFGNTCIGNATVPGVTAIGLDNGVGVPLIKSAGPWELRGGGPGAVITRWKALLGSGQGPLVQQLVAFKQMDEQADLLVGESAIETLVEGTNEFATRIPIPEYAHIGLRGPASTLICDSAVGEVAGTVEGPFLPGETRHFQILTDKGVPAIAIAERDEDGDGYGDLTQDGCPIKAAFHDLCPMVALENGIQGVRRRGILVRAGANVSAQMQLSGSVTWRPPPRRIVGSTRLVRQPKRTARLDGGTQSVAAKTRALFWVPLPKAVIARLRRMAPEEHLNAKLRLVVFGALELEGETRTKELHAKLPGRGQPAKRGNLGGAARPPAVATLPE